MKVLEPRPPEAVWSMEAVCKGGRAVKCGAKLLVDEEDITVATGARLTPLGPSRGMFWCPECGSCRGIPGTDIPEEVWGRIYRRQWAKR
ncbi:MAG: hypothetical protein ACYTFG_00035 [Planctomycetota bacterium]|jgi:hypothetical protein